MHDIPLFPDSASTLSDRVDELYAFLIGVSVLFGVLIAVALLVLSLRYRRRSEDEAPKPVHGALLLELGWSVVPFVIAMVIFWWGTSVFFALERAPREAMEILVVGKRWMWKFQHLDGRREVNELHVPTGTPVRLTMASEDVIHSLFIPVFRIKQDVVPGHWSTLWFEATRPGRYHLFCAEYCGTRHSAMGGWITVMRPEAFARWQSGGGAGQTPAEAGARIFQERACATCHRDAGRGVGPSLRGLFGTTIELEGGGSAVADAAYLRESILQPNAKVVKGFPRAMPTFQGQLSEEEVMSLVAYLRSLTGETP